MSKIFFPLRSNAAWFLKEETRKHLEYQIKTCFILYDELIFQDAQYHCTIWENASFDVLIRPKSIGFDRKKIKFFEPGTKASIFIGPHGQKAEHQLIGGEVQFGYQVDFYPLMLDSGLVDEDYIQFVDIDLNETIKKQAQKHAEQDKDNSDLCKVLNLNIWHRKKVLESLYIDSALALYFGSPFSIDYNVGPAVQWKHNEARKIYKPPIQDVFFTNWLALGLLDFGDLSWQQVVKIRESAAGKELRAVIDRIIGEVSNLIEDISDAKDLHIIVERLFTKELLQELSANVPSNKKVILNLGMNLLPFYLGLVTSGIKDTKDLIRTKKSWISLLKY
jgi:hypothetical protein